MGGRCDGIENGELRMDGEKFRIENGELRMKRKSNNCKLSILNYELLIGGIGFEF